ncbi:hypothetical protein [Mycolicibacterium goodii]|nr:hypothetical protein [Mycolicibacterium goodii]MBU8834436.1 hypothetical protein [Mycolicibacterium goodii]
MTMKIRSPKILVFDVAPSRLMEMMALRTGQAGLWRNTIGYSPPEIATT